ncbi:MAG: hypothetical protein HFJ50_01995 [Clostridia bacterium]|jgi:hypothetical protein|nr:hypothetical protein [Clostridia bacterium]
MRNLIKRILGIERLDKIVVSMAFKEHPPKESKMISRENYYIVYHKFKVPIVITNKYDLIDGYTSYLIAKQLGKKYVKVTRV